MNILKNPVDFEGLVSDLSFRILNDAAAVDTGHWQAMRDVPMTKTRELQNVVIEVPIAPTSGSWAADTHPNLPWAENQFQERVAGEPVNPGKTYKEWPYYKGNVEKHKEQGQFSHTYMERFWPRRANRKSTMLNNKGARYELGDLYDVVSLLAREPYTRQAYLPVWFPEDTGAHHKERVPCTLGYHFMLRQDKLHVFYPIRSCDLIRHFRDDVYMAGRLCQWVIEQLIPRRGKADERDTESTSPWAPVYPGSLSMFIPSLHVFEGDLPALKRKYVEGE